MGSRGSALGVVSIGFAVEEVVLKGGRALLHHLPEVHLVPDLARRYDCSTHIPPCQASQNLVPPSEVDVAWLVVL